MNTEHPSEHDLHAYVDGQLDPERRRWVEAYLARDAEAARSVERLRRQARELRAALPLPAGSAVDPALLRRRLRARRSQRLTVAASLVLALGLGGLGGWQARDMAIRASILPMADAVQAYRMFAVDEDRAVDVAVREPGDLQAWLGRHFVQAPTLPDFDAYGFRPVGARLMVTEQGPAAVVLYRDAQGESVVFYIRPPGRLSLIRGSRRDGDLMAQYWSDDGYAYAVVSPAAGANMENLQRAVAPLI